MVKEFTKDDDDILAALGVEVKSKKVVNRTPREERIIAGFEEIQRFVEEHGRTPQHSEVGDAFERLYAVRLDRIRELQECRDLVEDHDCQELLKGYSQSQSSDPDELDDDALLASLGVEVEAQTIAVLKHVRSTAEKKAAEEIASREKCENFHEFEYFFEAAKRDIKQGTRKTLPVRRDAGFNKALIKKGNFFIHGGLLTYVADVGEITRAPNGDKDARLHLVFSNGTESSMLLRSLQRSLYKDDTSRIVSEIDGVGPLFSDKLDNDDTQSGKIYVLRSESTHPLVVKNREAVHKIGVTSMDVDKRIAGAHLQSTFLMANVEVVATYELYNINQTKLENLIHRIFGPARLEIEIMDRLGNPIVPREWFLVPLFVIDEAIQKIKDGTISDFKYDIESASLQKRD